MYRADEHGAGASPPEATGDSCISYVHHVMDDLGKDGSAPLRPIAIGGESCGSLLLTSPAELGRFPPAK